MKPVDVNSNWYVQNNNKGPNFDASDDVKISRQKKFFSKSYTSSGLKKMLCFKKNVKNAV